MRPTALALELAGLRRQLASLSREGRILPRERVLAEDLLQLRLRMNRILRGVQSCSSCASGYPLPNGRYPGGYCCGSPTERLFTEDELARLHAAGTRVWQLYSRATGAAGCAFRTATGCSLAPAHRPSTCVSYICRDLARELKQRGDLDRAEALAARITRLANRLAHLRRERLLDTLLGAG